MKKDIKKSSYYVWFLGAEEAKGLRGSEFMVPVIQHLVEREKEVEPFKVTLQVSHKGLKIMQNVAVGYRPLTKIPKTGKTEVVKHFIPHHSITSVYQEEDIVSCILLLYNPVTKCPVHVHAYRCDSVETAEILSGQLQTLTGRPANQKKLEEIESKLKAKGLVQSVPSGNSDRSSARESDMSGGSSNSDRLSGFSSQESRIANLYDSLAAELKEKLCTGSQQNHAPILLPPRDYDTIHRQKGNLSGIDFRRCLNLNIVGINAPKNKKNDLISAQASGSTQHLAATPRTKIGSSGGSSGIGSDHAPSPEQETDNRYLDNQSTSDEEWNTEPNEDSLFLVQSANNWQTRELSLPRARRHNSSGFDSSPVTSPSSANTPPDERYVTEPAVYCTKKPVRSMPSYDFECKQKCPEDVRVPKHTFFDKDASKSEMKLNAPPKKRCPEERQRSPSPNVIASPKERFKDAKEKFLLLERERLAQQEKPLLHNNVDVAKRKAQELSNAEPYTAPQQPPAAKPRTSKCWKRGEDDKEVAEAKHRAAYRRHEFEGTTTTTTNEQRRSVARVPYHRNNSAESLDSDEYLSVAPTGGYRSGEQAHNASGRTKVNSLRAEEVAAVGRFPVTRMSRYCSDDRAVEIRPRCKSPANSGSSRPAAATAARPYFEDCIPERTADNKRYGDMYRGGQLSVAFANDESIPLRRYRSPIRHQQQPLAQPQQSQEDRLARNHSYSQQEDGKQRRAVGRSDSKYRAKPSKTNEREIKRSMLNTIEDEKRRHSNEIAKEFNRRSYQDHRTGSETSTQGSLGYHEINEQDKYPGPDREVWTNHNKLIKNGKCGATDGVVVVAAAAAATPAASPRYRHSYAEPFHHAQPINHHHHHRHEILQRTNSSLSSGRIGIAAIHRC